MCCIVQSNRKAKVNASLAEKGEYYSNRPPTPLLDTINYPIHMKNLSTKVIKKKNESPSIKPFDPYLLLV